MEPYKPNKPWISVNLPSREELIAMAMGLIPGGRALKNMHDNPEGPFTETLDLAAEDLVPFYANLIKPAVKGEDINLRNNLLEAALIGLPLNGPRGVRRTDPKRVPIDEARTAEFNQKLEELIRNPELTPSEKIYINALHDSRALGNDPTATALNRNENILGQVLDRYGLGDYYDDIVFGRNARNNVDDFINPEEYKVDRKYFGDGDPMDVPYNYLNDEYGHDYLFRNRDNETTFDQAKDWYEAAAANRRNVDKQFDDFIVDYYDKDKFNYEPRYINGPDYEFTPRRLKEKFGDGNINQQELLNEYIDRTIKPSSQWQEKVIDILKSDLSKEEKRALIKDIYGDVEVPIEIEELLL